MHGIPAPRHLGARQPCARVVNLALRHLPLPALRPATCRPAGANSVGGRPVSRALHATPGAAQRGGSRAETGAAPQSHTGPQALLMADPALGSGLERRLDALIRARYGSGPDVPAPARVLLNLVHYLWPVGEPTLRLRVLASLTCLVAAKLLNIQVPFFFKHVVDSLGTHTSAHTCMCCVRAVCTRPQLAVSRALARRLRGAARKCNVLACEIASHLRHKIVRQASAIAALRARATRVRRSA